MIRRLLLFCALFVSCLGGALTWWAHQPLMASEATSSVRLVIPPGSSLKATAKEIAQLTGANSTLLLIGLRLADGVSGKNKPIRSGTYAISSQLTPWGLLQKLMAGEEMLFSITIPEGWTFQQMRHLIDAAPHLQHETAQWTYQELMQALGKSELLPEGRFFPDTYVYAYNASDLSIYKQALARLDKHLQMAWDQRVEGLPFKNSDDLLTLASIVEKETGDPQDRAEIAGVFINRLKKGMLLQTDPTVIYGMGERFAQQGGNIRRSDLRRDTPYNTYIRPGLPPGPIALVGRAALQAAAQPKTTQSLYFVARGDGTSHFSQTLAQHNAAVNQFILKKK